MSTVSDLIPRGARVYVGGNAGEPAGLLDQLAQEGIPDGVQFVQFPLPGFNTIDFTGLNDSASLTTFFMTPALKNAVPERLHFQPMQMREVFEYVKRDIDVALVQVARDREGRLRAGPSVDFFEAAISHADVVIAELNTAVTAPAGAPLVVESRLAHVVETNRLLPEMPAPKIDDAARAIGDLVAGLIRDGDCIQTGIGAIPAAILGALGDKNDLGLHGGLLDDGGRALIETGVVTGARKPIDTGKHVTGMALGSRSLYDWVADRPDVLFRGADHTHEVSVIRQIDGFVSVNSAVEVDLFGQVNAEFAGGRQLSGTGGSVDFMRGARAARNGRSIIAMNATARGGSLSRIVAKVDLVTALRTDVDTVVTEFGIAEIGNLPVAARAEALIRIAAPQFRDELREQIPG